MEQYNHVEGLLFYFLIDGRFGGEVMSLTEADLDQQGCARQRVMLVTVVT